jgi:mRNA interferase MazF
MIKSGGNLKKVVILLSKEERSPRRGEVWQVDFNPTKGSEIKKLRPAVVISSDAMGSLPIKLVAPITTWNDSFIGKLWLVSIEPTETNGLTQRSVIDTLQIRGVDIQSRLIKKLGVLTAPTMEEIAASIAIVVEYQ